MRETKEERTRRRRGSCSRDMRKEEMAAPKKIANYS
jgi:hypothetical protein